MDPFSGGPVVITIITARNRQGVELFNGICFFLTARLVVLFLQDCIDDLLNDGIELFLTALFALLFSAAMAWAVSGAAVGFELFCAIVRHIAIIGH
eukprot:13158913-Ditylum_brightwellii.AAC.1